MSSAELGHITKRLAPMQFLMRNVHAGRGTLPYWHDESNATAASTQLSGGTPSMSSALMSAQSRLPRQA
jgi:hypothetical protein